MSGGTSRALEDQVTSSSEESPATSEIWLCGNSLEQNLISQKPEIIKCLDPTDCCLFQLTYELGVQEICHSNEIRSKRATSLVEAVIKNKAYSAFLEGLKDSDHMGHYYIVSLLTGTQYASPEDISVSLKLSKSIQKHSSMALKTLILDHLKPYLT